MATTDKTLEALAAWARTFDGAENASKETLPAALAQAFAHLSGAPCGERQLLRHVKRWYAQELAKDVSALIDEADDVIKLGSLVLGAAVQSAKKQEHIATIMRLDEEVQAELMVLVQRAMSSTAQAPSCSLNDVHEEDRRASLEEIARLKDAKTEAETKGADDLVRERRRSVEATSARDEAFASKASAEATLSKVRSKLRESELTGERREREKVELERRCERLEASLQASSEAHKTLADELDVARSRARDADGAEARVIKLRKKLEDVSTQQRELQDLDDANARHVQEITRLEVLLASREKRDVDVEQMRGEKASLEARVQDLQNSLGTKDDELRRVSLQKEESESQRRFFEDELAAQRPAPQSLEQMAPVFEQSSSELRDRLRTAQRDVARLEAEAEARLEREAADVAALRDKVADLEFERARDKEAAREKPPPAPSLDATQRLHALAQRDATIQKLRHRLETNSEAEELRKRFAAASHDAVLDREAQDATILELERRLASVATERDAIIGDLQRHLAEESTNTLNAVAEQDNTIADLRRRLANNTSEAISERDAVIIELRDRLSTSHKSSPAVEDALSDLRQRVAEAQQQTAAELAERDATIAKLTADREVLETYTQQNLGNIQEKYKVLMQTYKNQIRDKQERIARLEGELKRDRDRHRRELASSAAFEPAPEPDADAAVRERAVSALRRTPPVSPDREETCV